MRRRAAVEPVIGHTKAEHRMGRNYLKGRDGDRINAVLAAAGYNFGLLLRWLGGLLRALLQALFTALSDPQPAKTGRTLLLHVRLIEDGPFAALSARLSYSPAISRRSLRSNALLTASAV